MYPFDSDFAYEHSLKDRLSLLDESSKEKLLDEVESTMIVALGDDFYEQIGGFRENGDITIRTKNGDVIEFGDFFRKYDFVPKISLEVQFAEEEE